jgi:uncharacterized damage-inducible protein DinB
MSSAAHPVSIGVLQSVIEFSFMNIREFLSSPLAHLAPEKVLDGLSAEDAERRITGAPHSIAEIVAHLAFWQDWFYARCIGQAIPLVASAAAGWPPTTTGSWPLVQSRFIDRLQQLAALADGDVTRPVKPSIEFGPLANYTVGEALVHVATHNGHHLGQVILLRQLLGSWPPPAGSWTW